MSITAVPASRAELLTLWRNNKKTIMDRLLQRIASLRVDRNGDLTDETGDASYSLEQFVEFSSRGISDPQKLALSSVRNRSSLWVLGYVTAANEGLFTMEEALEAVDGMEVGTLVRSLIKSVRNVLVFSIMGLVCQNHSLDLHRVLSQTITDPVSGNLRLVYSDVLDRTWLGQLVQEARYVEARDVIIDRRPEVIEQLQMTLGCHVSRIERAGVVASGLLAGSAPLSIVRKAMKRRPDYYPGYYLVRSALEEHLLSHYSSAEEMPLLDCDSIENYWGISENLDFLTLVTERVRIVNAIDVSQRREVERRQRLGDVAEDDLVPPWSDDIFSDIPEGLDIESLTGALAVKFVVYCIIYDRTQGGMGMTDIFKNAGQYSHRLYKWMYERVEQAFTLGDLGENREEWHYYWREHISESGNLLCLLCSFSSERRLELERKYLRLVCDRVATLDHRLQGVANLTRIESTKDPMWPAATAANIVLLQAILPREMSGDAGVGPILKSNLATGTAVDRLDLSQLRAVMLSLSLRLKV